jgi:cytochrome b involved in lipid metabolism
MKKIILGVVAVIIIGGGYYGYELWEEYAPESYVQKDGTTLNTTTGAVSTTTQSFTMADVATHNTQERCYSVIQNKVYDLTLWVNAHPGGSKAILSLCGIDGTEKFMKKHKGGEKFMTALARFYIGDIK